MKKSVVLSAIAGVLLVAGLAFVPAAKAQTVSVEETLLALTQQLVTLVQAISTNFTQQFAAQDARITSLENRIKVLENASGSVSQNVGQLPVTVSGAGGGRGEPLISSTPFDTLSVSDQNAIGEMIRTLPDSPPEDCAKSTSGTTKNMPWSERRSNDRIFCLMCVQIGR